METNEYFSYVTSGIAALNERVRILEDNTFKVFAYTLNSLSNIDEEIKQLNNTIRYLPTQNVTDDIYTKIGKIETALQHSSYTFNHKLTDIESNNSIVFGDLNSIIDNIQNDLGEVKQHCSKSGAVISSVKQPSFWERFKESIYNFVFYFKIQREHKLQLIETEKKRQEDERKRKAEEEAMRQAQKELEIKRQQEAEQKRLEAERQKKLHKQQVNNKINDILNGIK